MVMIHFAKRELEILLYVSLSTSLCTTSWFHGTMLFFNLFKSMTFLASFCELTVKVPFIIISLTVSNRNL